MKSPWCWGVPLFAIIALAVLLILGDNVPLFYFMNRILSYASDGLWIHLSLIGEGQLVFLFILLLVGRRPDLVWQYVLATLIGGIFVHVLKQWLSVLRPPASLLADSFHLIGPALHNHAFPSGHTTTAFVVAGLFCLQRVNVWFKILALLLAIFVGFSRIASGVHWPLDILGAAAGGWMVAIAVVWLADYWRAGLNIWVQRAFALIVTPLSVWAVWPLWQQYHDVYPSTVMLIILLLVSCLGLSVPGQLRLFNLRR